MSIFVLDFSVAAVVVVVVVVAAVAIAKNLAYSDLLSDNQFPGVHSVSHETLALYCTTSSTVATTIPFCPSTCAPIHETSNQSQAKHAPRPDTAV